MPEKKYCNITIEIFSKKHKDGKQTRDKLEKLIDENFGGELTKMITYPYYSNFSK